jgi:hypothetical protein
MHVATSSGERATQDEKNVLVPVTNQFCFHSLPSFFIEIANRHPSTSSHERFYNPKPNPSNTTSHQRDSAFQHAQVKRFLEISYLRTDQPGVDGGAARSNGTAVRHSRTEILESSSDIALSQANRF